MKLLLFFIAIAFFLIAPVQPKGEILGVSKFKITSISKKDLWGKWRSTKDKNSILVFKGTICIDYYGRRVVDTLNVALSESCDLRDSTKFVDINDAHLLLYSYKLYNYKKLYQECNEILNLSKSYLSYMNSDVGGIRAFERILK